MPFRRDHPPFDKLSGSRLRESSADSSFRDFRLNSLNTLYALAAARRA
jgi:hypothetical protein